MRSLRQSNPLRAAISRRDVEFHVIVVLDRNRSWTMTMVTLSKSSAVTTNCPSRPLSLSARSANGRRSPAGFGHSTGWAIEQRFSFHLDAIEPFWVVENRGTETVEQEPRKKEQSGVEMRSPVDLFEPDAMPVLNCRLGGIHDELPSLSISARRIARRR